MPNDYKHIYSLIYDFDDSYAELPFHTLVIISTRDSIPSLKLIELATKEFNIKTIKKRIDPDFLNNQKYQDNLQITSYYSNLSDTTLIPLDNTLDKLLVVDYDNKSDKYTVFNKSDWLNNDDEKSELISQYITFVERHNQRILDEEDRYKKEKFINRILEMINKLDKIDKHQLIEKLKKEEY